MQQLHFLLFLFVLYKVFHFCMRIYHVYLSLTRWCIEVMHTKKRFELVVITVQIIVPIICSKRSLDANLVKGACTNILWDLVRVP